MTDPIEDLIGDHRAFAALQRDRLVTATSPNPLPR
jgi:hypothetical protein